MPNDVQLAVRPSKVDFARQTMLSNEAQAPVWPNNVNVFAVEFCVDSPKLKIIMQESAAISSDAAGTVPLELLALLMKLKHHLDPEAPGLPDKVTGEMVEDLKAAAKLLHEAFKDISDATLEVAMHGLSSRRSQWGRWLQFYRANYAAISSRRCNYANALEEFVTSYNAVYNPPSAANTASAVEEPYANLVKHFKARMKQVTYQSGAGTLTFTPIGRNTVPFSRKLADLHLTSADFGNVDRTFNSAADVKSIPAFAQIVEDYIVGIQNKLNPSKAMSAAYASANARHARANPAYNVRQEKFGYEFSCTGFQDYFLSTNNLKIIEDFICKYRYTYAIVSCLTMVRSWRRCHD